jgi:hypothetical protein
MALKNNKNAIVYILFFLSILDVAQAKIILPELLTKQAVGNIRFLSQDGKFTYYQKRSGSLLFSSNYKVAEILTGKLGTQYTVIGTSARKKVIVLQNENYHTFYSQRALEKIFLLDFGETTAKEIGTGAAARLHLNDSWISYYDYYSTMLTFEHTTNSALRFTIRLNNRINPYFTPQVIMSDEDTVYYTDLSENGAPGLLQFKRSTKKAEVIYKTTTPMIKAEICLHNNSLIMGLFGINSSTEGSTISKVNLPIADFTKRSLIYKSAINDIGQLVCDYDKNALAFIKNYGTNENYKTDIVELNPETQKLTLLSELNTVTSILNMDGTILALDKGKYFIAKGNNDYKNIDSLKSLPPSGANAAIKKMDEDLKDD